MGGLPLNLLVCSLPPPDTLFFPVKKKIQQVTQENLFPDTHRRAIELNGFLGVATKVQRCQKPLSTLPFGMNGAYARQETQRLFAPAGLHEADRRPPCGVI